MIFVKNNKGWSTIFRLVRLDEKGEICEYSRKIFEYKSLSLKLIGYYKALEEAMEKHFGDVEEIYIKILELQKAVGESVKGIKTMRGNEKSHKYPGF